MARHGSDHRGWERSRYRTRLDEPNADRQLQCFDDRSQQPVPTGAADRGHSPRTERDTIGSHSSFGSSASRAAHARAIRRRRDLRRWKVAARADRASPARADRAHDRARKQPRSGNVVSRLCVELDRIRHGRAECAPALRPHRCLSAFGAHRRDRSTTLAGCQAWLDEIAAG